MSMTRIFVTVVAACMALCAGPAHAGPVYMTGPAAVGTDSPLSGPVLHVVDVRNIPGTYPPLVTQHAAVIENTYAGCYAKVLALRVNRDDPGDSVNFITFFDVDEAVGAIEGDNAGGITLDTTAGDFAECLPKERQDDELLPGQIVGLHAGKLSKRTRDAQRVMVVSTAPAVRGNHPPRGQESHYAAVAFVGQAAVKVRGAVRAGDYIVPSGREDGTGVAVAASDLTAAQAVQVVGRALEAASGEGVKGVRTLVGLPRDQMWQRLLGARDARLAALEARTQAIEALAQGRGAATPVARAGLPACSALLVGLLLGAFVVKRVRKEAQAGR